MNHTNYTAMNRLLILIFSASLFACSYQGFDDDNDDQGDRDEGRIEADNSAKVATKTPTTTTTTTTPDLYFGADMSGITLTKRFASDGYDIGGTWDALKALPQVSSVYFNDIGSVPTYALQEIRLDPAGTGRKTIWSQIISDDPNTSGTTRAQMSMRFASGVNLGVYHTSHRMYIHPDFDFLKTYTLKKIDWSIIFEIWNEDGISKGIFPDGDVAGSCRWSFSIENAGTNKPWFWKIRGDYMQPNALKNKGFWIYTNTAVPIPLGKWFTLDMYMKRGDGTNGKMIITITPDGGAPVTLFNISNSTVYPGRPELNLYSWQPFKFYFNPIYLDYMKSKGKTLGVHYNDFKWYKN